jgi:DnaJ-domain-containing protein 1
MNKVLTIEEYKENIIREDWEELIKQYWEKKAKEIIEIFAKNHEFIAKERNRLRKVDAIIKENDSDIKILKAKQESWEKVTKEEILYILRKIIYWFKVLFGPYSDDIESHLKIMWIEKNEFNHVKLKERYRKLARKYHPDSLSGCHEKFIQMQKSHEYLKLHCKYKEKVEVLLLT